jgi:hypothetical protein
MAAVCFLCCSKINCSKISCKVLFSGVPKDEGFLFLYGRSPLVPLEVCPYALFLWRNRASGVASRHSGVRPHWIHCRYRRLLQVHLHCCYQASIFQIPESSLRYMLRTTSNTADTKPLFPSREVPHQCRAQGRAVYVPA